MGNSFSLAQGIADATGIHAEAITKERRVHSYSIAQRMYWASNRTTKRIEDRAYSLLGVFDVNMPVMYGEGKKAFRRLQEELMRSSTDQTLFVFYDVPSEARIASPWHIRKSRQSSWPARRAIFDTAEGSFN